MAKSYNLTETSQFFSIDLSFGGPKLSMSASFKDILLLRLIFLRYNIKVCATAYILLKNPF